MTKIPSFSTLIKRSGLSGVIKNLGKIAEGKRDFVDMSAKPVPKQEVLPIENSVIAKPVKKKSLRQRLREAGKPGHCDIHGETWIKYTRRSKDDMSFGNGTGNGWWCCRECLRNKWRKYSTPEWKVIQNSKNNPIIYVDNQKGKMRICKHHGETFFMQRYTKKSGPFYSCKLCHRLAQIKAYKNDKPKREIRNIHAQQFYQRIKRNLSVYLAVITMAVENKSFDS